MSCADFENLIALSVTGDLDAREAARVQQHLAACESCRALAEDLSADLQWLQSAHREPADRAMLQQVRASVMRRLEAEQSRWNRPFGGLTAPGWRWEWVAVTAVVGFLVAGVAWWMRSAIEPRADVAVTVAGGTAKSSGGAPPRLRQKTPQAAPASPANPRIPEPSVAAVPGPRIEISVKRESLRSTPAAASAQPDALRKQSDLPAAPPVAAPRFGEPPVSEPPASEPPVSEPAVSQQAVSKPPVSEPAAYALAAGSSEPAGQLRAELFVVSAEEPDAPPVEGVRVRMPTSNPGIVVYWLMDEKDKGD